MGYAFGSLGTLTAGNKADKLETVVELENYDPIAVTERWDVNYMTGELQLGATSFSERLGKRGGGVVIHVKEGSDCEEVPSTSHGEAEQPQVYGI